MLGFFTQWHFILLYSGGILRDGLARLIPHAMVSVYQYTINIIRMHLRARGAY